MASGHIVSLTTCLHPAIKMAQLHSESFLLDEQNERAHKQRKLCQIMKKGVGVFFLAFVERCSIVRKSRRVFDSMLSFFLSFLFKKEEERKKNGRENSDELHLSKNFGRVGRRKEADIEERRGD